MIVFGLVFPHTKLWFLILTQAYICAHKSVQVKNNNGEQDGYSFNYKHVNVGPGLLSQAKVTLAWDNPVHVTHHASPLGRWRAPREFEAIKRTNLLPI